MLDRDTVKTMLETSHASVPHLAAHFGVSPAEMISFLKTNDLPAPTAFGEQYKHIRKLFAAQRPEPTDWEQLVFDDADKRYVNGVDLLSTTGRIDANEILAYYGQHNCLYSGEPTNKVMAADGNGQNFLVSNLVPITEEVVKERKFGEEGVLFFCGKEYVFAGPSGDTKIGIHLQACFDSLAGTALNAPYLDASVEQWLHPWFEKFTYSDILPAGVPAVPELMALWVWKQLSTVACLKGLARVEVNMSNMSAFITKDLYAQMVVGLMRRSVQSRTVAARPSSIIMPGQAGANRLPPGVVLTP
jgi:hypothetical protein